MDILGVEYFYNTCTSMQLAVKLTPYFLLTPINKDVVIEISQEHLHITR